MGWSFEKFSGAGSVMEMLMSVSNDIDVLMHQRSCQDATELTASIDAGRGPNM